jgi:hypothetical protein
MSADPLRRSYDNLLAASRENAARAGCIAPDQIVDLVEHRTPDPERLPQLSHVLSCEHCLREYEILRSLRSGAELMAPGRWMRTPVARAIQLVLVAGVVAFAAYTVTSWFGARNAVPLMSPRGRVATSAPLVLRWHAVPGAASYRVEVGASAGVVRFSVFALDTVQSVPDSVRLTAGTPYWWRVHAVMRDGTELRSRVWQFQLAPP